MHVLHIYPVEDWIEHDTKGDNETCSCVCRPRAEFIGILDEDGDIHLIKVLIIHRQVREDYVDPRWWRRVWCWFRSFFK